MQRIIVMLIAMLAAVVPASAVTFADHAFSESAGPDSYWIGLAPPGDGGSLTVAVSGLDARPVRKAIRAWNAAAGTDLFELVSGPAADITIRPGSGTYARPMPDGCAIIIHTNHSAFVTHELGHCLGLADHPAPACEGESYRGIMSYCWRTARIADADIAAIRRLGHAP